MKETSLLEGVIKGPGFTYGGRYAVFRVLTSNLIRGNSRLDEPTLVQVSNSKELFNLLKTYTNETP